MMTKKKARKTKPLMSNAKVRHGKACFKGLAHKLLYERSRHIQNSMSVDAEEDLLRLEGMAAAASALGFDDLNLWLLDQIWPAPATATGTGGEL